MDPAFAWEFNQKWIYEANFEISSKISPKKSFYRWKSERFPSTIKQWKAHGSFGLSTTTACAVSSSTGVSATRASASRGIAYPEYQQKWLNYMCIHRSIFWNVWKKKTYMKPKIFKALWVLRLKLFLKPIYTWRCKEIRPRNGLRSESKQQKKIFGRFSETGSLTKSLLSFSCFDLPFF